MLYSWEVKGIIKQMSSTTEYNNNKQQNTTIEQ